MVTCAETEPAAEPGRHDSSYADVTRDGAWWLSEIGWWQKEALKASAGGWPYTTADCIRRAQAALEGFRAAHDRETAQVLWEKKAP